MGSYARFAAMIGTSTAVMFGLMYLNTYEADHVFFSETRLYMAFVMGAAMAAIMLAFMLKVNDNRAMNIGSFAGSAAGRKSPMPACAGLPSRSSRASAGRSSR